MRPTEALLIGYFGYTSILAVVRLAAPLREELLIGNLTVFAAYALIFHEAHGHEAPGRLGRWIDMLRDWLPLALCLMAYRQMGWFAPAEHNARLERAWIVWDRLLLRDWGLRAGIEFLGPLLPAVLEISYLLVYVVGTFGVVMLYVYRQRERADRFLFLAVLGLLLSYAQFPLWPSEPPRTVFPGEDFPTIVTVFRKLNGNILGGYGIHTSVFPSAHVSGAFAAAFAMMRTLPEKPWVGRVLLIVASLIALATVYGRYHYAVDALAGFGVSLVALWIDIQLHPAGGRA